MRRITLIFFTACTFALASISQGAHPLATWHQRDPLPQGEPLYKALEFNGQMLFFGGSATNMILTSSNSLDWEIGPSSGTRGFVDVARGANGLVAVGTDVVAFSPDGTNWKRAPLSGTFEAVAYGNGVYVVSGTVPGTYVSANGTNWTPTPGFGLSSIIFAQNKFVAIESTSIRVSTNGTTWVPPNTFIGSATAIGYGAGTFLAAEFSGAFYQSADAITWTAITVVSPVPGPIRSLIYGSNVWLAVPDVSAALPLSYSTNMTNWSTAPTGPISVVGASFVGGRFVVGGTRGRIYTSSDGQAWTLRTKSVVALPIYRTANLRGEYFAVGDGGGIYHSFNAADWEKCVVLDTARMRAIARSDSLYLAGGDSSILSSLDGTNWTFTGQGFPIRGLAWGDGRFVAAGPQNRVQYSPDGTNWFIPMVSSGIDWNDAIYAQGRFFLCGSGGRVAVSSNGINWMVQALHDQFPLRSITYANGVFAVLENGFLLSTNGTNWTFRQPLTTTVFNSLAGGDGYWVACDFYRRPLFSRDLVNWFGDPLRTSYDLNSVTAADHSFIIGGNGDLWQSDPLVTLAMARTNTVSLTGPSGRAAEVQRSTSLSADGWQTVTNLTLSNSPAVWSDGELLPGAFYRAVLR